MKVASLSTEKLPFGSYYINGNDDYWRHYAESHFKNLIPEENRDFSLFFVDKLSGSDNFSESLSSLPFLSDFTVIIVKDKDFKLKAEDEEKIALSLSSAENYYALFVYGESLSSKLKKLMTPIDAFRLPAGDPLLSETVDAIVGKGKIDRAALYKLYEYTGGDMAKIQVEAAKLTAFTGGKKIKAEDITEVVTKSVEANVFELTTFLSQKNRRKAMEIAYSLLETGVSKAYLLSLMLGQYRRMLHASLSSLDDALLAEALGIKEFAAKKARELSAKFTKVQLKKSVDILVCAEFSFKSGEESEENAFKNALAKLVSDY